MGQRNSSLETLVSSKYLVQIVMDQNLLRAFLCPTNFLSAKNIDYPLFFFRLISILLLEFVLRSSAGRQAIVLVFLYRLISIAFWHLRSAMVISKSIREEESRKENSIGFIYRFKLIDLTKRNTKYIEEKYIEREFSSTIYDFFSYATIKKLESKVQKKNSFDRRRWFEYRVQ